MKEFEKGPGGMQAKWCEDKLKERGISVSRELTDAQVIALFAKISTELSSPQPSPASPNS